MSYQRENTLNILIWYGRAHDSNNIHNNYNDKIMQTVYYRTHNKQHKINKCLFLYIMQNYINMAKSSNIYTRILQENKSTPTRFFFKNVQRRCDHLIP